MQHWKPPGRYFNPRTPCGVRPQQNRDFVGSGPFQSTHPVWGATGQAWRKPGGGCHFNPRTPCGVRPPCAYPARPCSDISIHAPRVGCDLILLQSSEPPVDFNPRTPCGVRRLPLVAVKVGFEFQSTHPVWGATGITVVEIPQDMRFQSTHPVWGATPAHSFCPKHSRISIHAPRVGCDTSRAAMSWTATNFNPRTPCGVRPTVAPAAKTATAISIHAPRVGCDGQAKGVDDAGGNFNPRTPCGVRLQLLDVGGHHIVISIHAPRVGCDGIERAWESVNAVFQSTHPVWGATRAWPPREIISLGISIHAPRVGCDIRCQDHRQDQGNFNPRTPCGVRPGCAAALRQPSHFNPRTPCGVRRCARGRPGPR